MKKFLLITIVLCAYSLLNSQVRLNEWNDTWMDSPGHKSNIINPAFKFMGCGAYQFIDSEWEDFFWVKSTQNFSSN